MLQLLSLWSHVLAAALFGALALAQLQHWNGAPHNRPLAMAFAVVAVWSAVIAIAGGETVFAQVAEGGRNLAFLAFMYGLMREADDDGSQRGVKAVYAALAAAIGCQTIAGGLMAFAGSLPGTLDALVSTGRLLGLLVAAGSLILVHNLYGQAAPGSRSALRFPMLALAAMWAYDLHLYTLAYFTHGLAADLFATRGLVLALLAPLFALGLRRHAAWQFQLSRAATFQSVSVIAILAYLLVMVSAARTAEAVGGNLGLVAQFGVLFVTTLAVLALLPSGRARAWLKVFLAKHVFEHRYDYRREWLRFVATLDREGADGAPLEQRVVKALADIGDSPAGLLLTVDDQYRLTLCARWNSDAKLPSTGLGAERLLRFIEAGTHVLDFAAIGGGRLSASGEAFPVPGWLSELENAWAGIPLIHSRRLVGLVLLEHPAQRRPLDWEDFDLFRTAGVQAASYIAEARGQQALADASRFEEFNRRFAFILHDIKNLVSQLSLVARNAERHADNPEFRADMVATLQSSVKKMNDLLVRLSPGAARELEAPRAVPIEPILGRLAGAKGRRHPVGFACDDGLAATANPDGLEQALAHLLQNAIDASAPDRPVELRAYESGGDVAIEVVDRGRGMSGEFVRTRLFQPFVSTKDSGFGIGAYEARALIHGMGGRLEVESAEGEGTCFTIFLAGVQRQPNPFHDRLTRERMRA
ncbi:PEP-CTERM system histidine kinase PrsK [Sphingosinicella sp. LHD-64]|uniref:XrtA/PEP-CTERM system histidine kinase PrsK n=1 Tax=Sphingosinicella sp. LHD-64 TaxID=3072139 RepID=UPI00280D1639|nr:XrtA/PEP-CTERM system histidine kinase PrsK [Sphingosinicella sp. LHD-64]MDQ8756611.1 PEP-CTERM system histidine kinase PrsK [Sphingosinicella sp. LHD-64]